jgi:hypothetical protein
MKRLFLALLIAGGVAGTACDDDEVSSAEEARRAYLGLDRSVELGLNLGMQGFNAAQSANIDAQSGPGEVSGTLTVTGQVDQGTSDNKGLRLKTAYVMYEDRITASTDGGTAAASGVSYDTDAAALPALDLQLRNIPASGSGGTGTFTGTFAGRVHMTGDLEGDVVLTLTLAGGIRARASGPGIERVPGSTRITGTAASDYGTYTVDVTR